jgi:uncharacterized membrane protein
LNTFQVLVLLLCIGAGTVGGVFFAFSTFIMRALEGLPATQGIAAMQRINVVVLNPLFLGVFMGTAVLGVVAMVTAFMRWPVPGSPLLAGSGLLYCLGSFAVTMMFNVPRNNRLARLNAESSEGAAYWPSYVREWLLWNHVRTIASVLSAAFGIAALTIAGNP